MSDFKFLIFISCFIANILISYAYFFAAIRRLLIPPTSGNLLVLLVPLIGMPGFFLVFLWGWIKHDRHQLTRFMTGWTLTLILIVVEFMLLSRLEKTPWESVVLLGGTMLMIALQWNFLIPFMRCDERMRALIREPGVDRVDRLCAMGPQILPYLRYMLSDEYQPTRLSAIECLSQLGIPGFSLLKDSTLDADPLVASAAMAALPIDPPAAGRP